MEKQQMTLKEYMDIWNKTHRQRNEVVDALGVLEFERRFTNKHLEYAKKVLRDEIGRLDEKIAKLSKIALECLPI